MKLFSPEKPCQPSVPNQNGGSMRPVEPPGPPPFGLLMRLLTIQSASKRPQYTAPGTRRLLARPEATGICSTVFANIWPMAPDFAGAHGDGAALVHDGVPSAGPPAS